MKLDEGKYLILKDPNKQVIRIYSLPDGTFSSDEDEEDEEEEEEEEGLWHIWCFMLLSDVLVWMKRGDVSDEDQS